MRSTWRTSRRHSNSIIIGAILPRTWKQRGKPPKLSAWIGGGGLYFNYAFTVIWVADEFWWWRSGLDGYRGRPHWVTVAVHSFLGFMFFNATVVFGSGFVRLFAVASMLILAVGAAGRTPRFSK